MCCMLSDQNLPETTEPAEQEAPLSPSAEQPPESVKTPVSARSIPAPTDEVTEQNEESSPPAAEADDEPNPPSDEKSEEEHPTTPTDKDKLPSARKSKSPSQVPTSTTPAANDSIKAASPPKLEPSTKEPVLPSTAPHPEPPPATAETRQPTMVTAKSVTPERTMLSSAYSAPAEDDNIISGHALVSQRYIVDVK